MKKKAVILFLFLFCMSFVFAGVTGKIITGKVSAQEVDVSLFILPVPATVEIFHPENKTYLINESLFLNYSATLAESVWYNLDGGPNITLTSNIYINLSYGPHELYIYANNSIGNESSVSSNFTTIEGLFEVIYDNYKSISKGASTDFRQIAFEDLQDLSNVILEDTIYGKILFLESINVTNDLNSGDGTVNIDINSDVSLNNIGVNTTGLPNFDKSATIWFYNLAFEDPLILKDGTECPSSICTKESYIGGTLKFNVSEFSFYSVKETPTTVAPVVSGGGGGGGGGKTIIAKKEFSVDKDKLKISIKQGETRKESFIIKNTGKNTKEFKISAPGIRDFVRISETIIEIKAGESRQIDIDFIVREDVAPSLYLGSILVQQGDFEEKIVVGIEVESTEALLDVMMDIPRRFLYVLPGEEILATARMYNLGELGKIDIYMEYSIVDLDGNIIVKQEETIAIDTQASVVKKLEIPEGTPYGEYLYYIRATYEGKSASASTWFNVGRGPFFNTENMLLLLALFIIIILILKHLRRIEENKKHVQTVTWWRFRKN